MASWHGDGHGEGERECEAEDEGYGGAGAGVDDEASARITSLKHALWLPLGNLVDSTTLDHDCNASPQFIAALTELVFGFVGMKAGEVEGFARHANRTTVTTADVLLLARNNASLKELLQQELGKIRSPGSNNVGKRRKGDEADSSENEVNNEDGRPGIDDEDEDDDMDEDEDKSTGVGGKRGTGVGRSASARTRVGSGRAGFRGTGGGRGGSGSGSRGTGTSRGSSGGASRARGTGTGRSRGRARGTS